MGEQPIIIHENSGDKHEELIAEKEQNAIVADNELDIVILDKSGNEHHEHTDENGQSITLIERVNTFDLSDSLIGFKRKSFKEMYELYCLHAREVFKKSMKLKCPITIFTDQDHAIKNTIRNVFPEARYRLCIWHLYQNAISRFGRSKGNKNFNDTFQRYLSGCINKEEFEECWASMISVYGLQDNSWFTRLYDLREK
ncbi:hypothetical protein C2S52_007699 [Perilla frutescens var. hirtella]|nr:hypothetical protein C2S52_007699 [Perilla frutescens var. hirtella]